ncbi:MAG TPA: 2-amino-4-hydroxy-6-hydroxymethyldihydropteridine diphosphokinase, partial [Pirellulales bacterium]|nr:2-amino-4-hydroxy-6-hydroxymethyldihydropteridine diphosphokinase [Pirellulales bacterium]
MPRCLIALGANLGDRAKTLSQAIERLDSTEGIAVLARSPWLETAPVGGPGEQPAFLNGAAIL